MAVVLPDFITPAKTGSGASGRPPGASAQSLEVSLPSELKPLRVSFIYTGLNPISEE